MPADPRQRRPVAASVPLLAGLLSQAVTTYALLVLVGRVVGPAAFGPLSALYVLITSLATGLFLPLEQEIARLRGSQRGSRQWDAGLLARALRVSLVTSLVVDAVMVAAWPVTTTILGDRPALLAALCVALPGYAVCFTMRGELAGRRQLTRYGWQLGIEGGSRVLLAAPLLLLRVHATGWYAAVFAVAPWIAAGASAVAWQRPHPELPAPPAEGLLRPVGLLVASSLASQVLVNAGPLVIALLAGPGDRTKVGAFLAALVVVRVPVFLFTAVQPSFLPAVAEHSAADRRSDFVRLIGRVLAAAAVFVVLSSLVAAALGPWFLTTFFDFGHLLDGRQFAEMAAAVGLFLLAAILAQALLGRSRHGLTTVGWVTGLVGLALGTIVTPGGAVGRASVGFLVGAGAATVALAVALAGDLRQWHVVPPTGAALHAGNTLGA